jgi:polyphenol oxidase
MAVMSLRLGTLPALEAVPGLAHGFERRLGPAGGEEREQTRRRVSAELATRGRLLLLRQVHGTAVQAAPWEGQPEGDAATADGPGLLLGIETADCLPVLLVDPRRRAVAAAHAGWRGTAAGVALRAVEALRAQGSRPEDLLAALGPGIGSCCYEVGEDVREAFGPRGAAFFRAGPRGRPHLDVRAANRAQLQDAGLGAGAIHDLAECTFCRADLYHSYRREGRGAGRMISFVGWERSPSP